jgi:hypothetical protein
VSETKPLLQRSSLALRATLAQVAFLILGSLLPQTAKHAIGTQGLWHRPLHLILFATTAATTRAASARLRLYTSIFLVALALSLEFAEHLLYLNLFEWHDVRDDLVGIAIGLLLVGSWQWSSGGMVSHPETARGPFMGFLRGVVASVRNFARA